MKTLEQCKQEIAVKHGYDGWDEITFGYILRDTDINVYINEAAELYAEEVAKAQREACAYLGKDVRIERGEGEKGIKKVLFVNVGESILSTPLVTDKK